MENGVVRHLTYHSETTTKLILVICNCRMIFVGKGVNKDLRAPELRAIFILQSELKRACGILVKI